MRPHPKPTAPAAPNAASARLRDAPSAYVTARMPSAAGIVIAAPTPCRPRAPMSIAAVVATAATNVNVKKMTNPTMRTLRRPNTSAHRPPTSRNPANATAYAEITHGSVATPTSSSAATAGSAMFTELRLRMLTNIVEHTSMSSPGRTPST